MEDIRANSHLVDGETAVQSEGYVANLCVASDPSLPEVLMPRLKVPCPPPPSYITCLCRGPFSPSALSRSGSHSQSPTPGCCRVSDSTAGLEERTSVGLDRWLACSLFTASPTGADRCGQELEESAGSAL